RSGSGGRVGRRYLTCSVGECRLRLGNLTQVRFEIGFEEIGELVIKRRFNFGLDMRRCRNRRRLERNRLADWLGLFHCRKIKVEIAFVESEGLDMLDGFDNWLVYWLENRGWRILRLAIRLFGTRRNEISAAIG